MEIGFILVISSVILFPTLIASSINFFEAVDAFTRETDTDDHLNEHIMLEKFDPTIYNGYNSHDLESEEDWMNVDLETFFDLSSNSSQEMHREIIDENTSYQPPLPAFKWQHGLTKDQISCINDKFWSSWPKVSNGKKENIDRHVYNVSKWLGCHPKIVLMLLNNDENTWQNVLMRCMLDPYKEKKKSTSGNKRRFHMTTLVWLAKPIHSTKKDYIISRLRAHWNGVTEQIARSRLTEYAVKYGKITSPEPLFEDDYERFKEAADAIYCEDAPRGQRNLGAGFDDLLHQHRDVSSLNSNGPPLPTRLKPENPRYNSGESWMNDLSLEQIAAIHHTIRKFWRERINDRVLTPAYLQVNKYLEEHESILESIKRGDMSAACLVAKMTIKSQYWRADI